MGILSGNPKNIKTQIPAHYKKKKKNQKKNGF